MMMLEEAGAETPSTVIATLKPSDQSEFSAPVNGLVTLGLMRKEENSLELTGQGQISLKTEPHSQLSSISDSNSLN